MCKAGVVQEKKVDGSDKELSDQGEKKISIRSGTATSVVVGHKLEKAAKSSDSSMTGFAMAPNHHLRGAAAIHQPGMMGEEPIRSNFRGSSDLITWHAMFGQAARDPWHLVILLPALVRVPTGDTDESVSSDIGTNDGY